MCTPRSSWFITKAYRRKNSVNGAVPGISRVNLEGFYNIQLLKTFRILSFVYDTHLTDE
jgi:hypothetical protein